MILDNLKLMNFRNYSSLDIHFSPEINFITGDNGSGKSNILEAVSVISNFKSVRNTSDSHIVKWGSRSYYCSGSVTDSEYEKFEVGFINENDKTKKKIKIDGKEITKASDYYGKLLSVVFNPSDINIITGAPELRRRYFDSVISKIFPDFIDELNDFKFVLNSRNILLKKIREGKTDNKQLDVWNRLFAEKAFIVLKKRETFIKDFNHFFSNTYSMISGEAGSPEIIYNTVNSVNVDELCKLIQSRLRDDLRKGSTGTGPQRDDFIFQNSESFNFNNYASQGQKRTASISLKLAEFEMISKIKQKKSIILVDDIFSELDEKRRSNMIDLLKHKSQIIFTMVNSDYIKKGIYGDFKIFSVDNGSIYTK